jgi:signal transduction histidine kinase
VRDNGRGFDAETKVNSAAGGLGLTSISERVRLLGGSHTIHSAPGPGTTLQIRIPIAVADGGK